MLPLVPTLAFVAPPLSPPRYFTNAENVRRIAAGRDHVAFATSGGVRVFERSTQKWRVYTKNDGLPTHNIHDIVFDRAQPGLLWVLCGSWGDWANDQPEPDLRIATLDLATGKGEVIAAPIAAPRTSRMGYPYFLNYRLSVSDDWAFVFTDKGVALGWDRQAKKWVNQPTVEPTPARASHYEGHQSRPLAVATAGDLLAFHVWPMGTMLLHQSQTVVLDGKTVHFNRVTPLSRDGRQEVVQVPHVLLYNTKTGRLTRHPLGQDLLGQSVTTPGDGDRTPETISSGSPIRFLPDTRPGSVLIESYGAVTQSVPKSTLSDQGPPIRRYRILHRVAPGLAQPIEVSREELAPAARRFENLATPLLYWTDFLLDGDRLWVAGYNDPNAQRTAGIACLDLKTGRWAALPVSATGLPANMVALYGNEGAVRIGGSYFQQDLVYVPDTDDFQAPKASAPAQEQGLRVGAIPDPRVQTEPEKQFEWAALRVLGQSGRQALVLGPAAPAQRFVRENGRFKLLPVTYDTLYFYDAKTKVLTRLDVRGLERLQPRAAGFDRESLFFLSEERLPEERRGTIAVVRWDGATGKLTRYPAALFREVGVAEQRRAGAQQQADLKRRQRERDLEQRRYPERPLPAIELRSIGEFVRGLQGSFVTAAGTTWLQLDRQLFRYERERDTWIAEGSADALAPEGESALWKSVGPDPWRFEFAEAGRLRYEVLRWSPTAGWQQLERGDDVRSAGKTLLFQDEALWLSGVGVLRLPQGSLRFSKPGAQ